MKPEIGVIQQWYNIIGHGWTWSAFFRPGRLGVALGRKSVPGHTAPSLRRPSGTGERL